MERPMAERHLPDPSHRAQQEVQPLRPIRLFRGGETIRERTRLLRRHTLKQVRRWIGMQVV
jgi:hypothetical protein